MEGGGRLGSAVGSTLEAQVDIHSLANIPVLLAEVQVRHHLLPLPPRGTNQVQQLQFIRFKRLCG